MPDLLTPHFLTALLVGGVAAGVPLMFASLGETIAESAGVLNVGLEGMMITGAFVGFLTTDSTGDLWLGLVTGAVAGMLMSLLMVVLCIRLGMDQIVVGIGIVLTAEGATSVLHTVMFGQSYPRLGSVATFEIPILRDIPVLGGSLFSQPLPVYMGLAAVVATGWMLRATSWGLSIRAAGERPASVDAAGVSVVRVRTVAELICGALAGLGGAYLSIASAGTFVPFVTQGAGFIAIVIAMLSRGRVYWSILGALLFGLSLSVATALQLFGIAIPDDAVFMLPFISVIVVLIVFARQARLPAALGLPYHRGSR